MTDPRNLSPDQREVLEASEQVALLPLPLVEDDFEEASNRALDLIEARGTALRGEDGLSLDVLAKYAAMFRREGHSLAADGVRRMIQVYLAGVQLRAEDAADNN